MAFLGNRPAENYISYDVQHFTTSATTNYTLDHAVANENELRLVINNVVQQPGSSYAYSASGTSLTLTSATSSTDTMYCVYLGKATSTVNPPSGSVGNSQIASSIITGQTAETSIATDDLILLSDTSASGALKKMTRANFISGLTNTPSWSVGRSANQSISNGTYTKIQFDLEFFDTASAFDNSSNYNFTVPSGQAGKYFISVSTRTTSSSDFDSFYIRVQKNNAEFLFNSIRNEFRETTSISSVVDLAVGDTLHVEAYNGEGSTIEISGSSDKPSGTHFSGFKLI